MDKIYADCMAVLADNQLLPESWLSVYLAGSRVRGWGNETSDLDVYIISNEPRESDTAELSPVPLEPSVLPVEVRYIDNRRWEVQYWLDAQVDQVLAKARGHGAQELLERCKDITRIDAVFLQRILYGMPASGPDWLIQRRAELKETSLNAMMAARALRSMDVCVEDATGQLDNNDTYSALLSAKLAFGWAVEAILAYQGELEESPKWRARRMRAANPPQLSFDDYWAVETMSEFDSNAPRKWIEKTLMLCHELAMEVVF